MSYLTVKFASIQTYRNNRKRWKLAYFLRKIQTLRMNNSRNVWIKNAKFSEYYFYMNTNIQHNFQIRISVPSIALILGWFSSFLMQYLLGYFCLKEKVSLFSKIVYCQWYYLYLKHHNNFFCLFNTIYCKSYAVF